MSMLTYRRKGEVVYLSGALDEHAPAGLEALLGTIEGGTTRLDLSGVSAANSPGIAAWTHFVKRLTKGSDVEFHRCPAVMIDYANILPATFGAGEVVSFHAPLRCSSCKHSEELLIHVKDLRSHDLIPGADKPCARCRKPMACEVEPASLLSFLSDLG